MGPIHFQRVVDYLQAPFQKGKRMVLLSRGHLLLLPTSLYTNSKLTSFKLFYRCCRCYFQFSGSFWNTVAYFKSGMSESRAGFLNLCNVGDKFCGKKDSMKVSFLPVVTNVRGLLIWSNTQIPFHSNLWQVEAILGAYKWCVSTFEII